MADEVAAALIVMSDHFAETPYYHPKHEYTRKRLYDAMNRVRRREGIRPHEYPRKAENKSKGSRSQIN